jgi:hypothetical protein
MCKKLSSRQGEFATAAGKKSFVQPLARAIALAFLKLRHDLFTPGYARAIIACTGEGNGEEASPQGNSTFPVAGSAMAMFLVDASSLPFAQVGRLDWDLILPVTGLIAAVGLGVWVIMKVKKWREAEAEAVPPTLEEQLAHYQQLVDDGELDPEEFGRIKAQLGVKPDEPTDTPAPPADQPPDSSIKEL